MKTAKEAAREYAENKYSQPDTDDMDIQADWIRNTVIAEHAFLAGIKRANRWIPEKEELPDNEMLVFLKALPLQHIPCKEIVGCGLLDENGVWCDEQGREFDPIKLLITHWRPIEHKKE